MAELKTKQTEMSVDEFLNRITDAQKQQDCRILLEMMRKATGAEPKMWGEAIVGFGNYHYKYESGREGDWFITGFSPRKQALTLYLTYGYEQYTEWMGKLGKYKVGKACLYINKLADVDRTVLESLIAKAVEENMKSTSER